MTELPKSEIMGLLKDASSLIKVRDNASSLSNAQRVPDAFHVVSLHMTMPCRSVCGRCLLCLLPLCTFSAMIIYIDCTVCISHGGGVTAKMIF